MRRTILILLVSAFVTTIMLPQEMAVPLNVQHMLLMRVLAFDRALLAQDDTAIVIGILYQSKVRSSQLVKEELMNIVEATTQKVNDTLVRWRPIDISDANDLQANLVKHHIDILYVTPVRAIGMKTIISVCRAKKILTLTGVSDFVEAGLAVGIGIKGDKPQIEINLAAAKAEGADFTSQLLKVARIIE